jgi:4-hydroxy-2-oxoheptanedioate aldolase
MTNPIRAALLAEKPALGLWMSLAAADTAELFADWGFAWAVVDLQHGSTTWDALPGVMRALRAGGAAGVVRAPWNDPSSITRALDLGAIGVIVPMVSTAAEARAASEAVRYPPDGTRSYGPIRLAPSNTAEANLDALCIVMIETAEGIENLEEIVTTPGVDGVFIGPIDLALGLGAGLDLTMESAAVTSSIDTVVKACRRHGRFASTLARDPEHAERLLRRGITVCTVGSDKSYLAAGARRAVEFIESVADHRLPA